MLCIIYMNVMLIYIRLLYILCISFIYIYTYAICMNCNYAFLWYYNVCIDFHKDIQYSARVVGVPPCWMDRQTETAHNFGAQRVGLGWKILRMESELFFNFPINLQWCNNCRLVFMRDLPNGSFGKHDTIWVYPDNITYWQSNRMQLNSGNP